MHVVCVNKCMVWVWKHVGYILVWLGFRLLSCFWLGCIYGSYVTRCVWLVMFKACWCCCGYVVNDGMWIPSRSSRTCFWILVWDLKNIEELKQRKKGVFLTFEDFLHLKPKRHLQWIFLATSPVRTQFLGTKIQIQGEIWERDFGFAEQGRIRRELQNSSAL